MQNLEQKSSQHFSNHINFMPPQLYTELSDWHVADTLIPRLFPDWMSMCFIVYKCSYMYLKDVYFYNISPVLPKCDTCVIEW